MPAILIHYHELALKGKNRSYFEKKLCREIQAFLKPIAEGNLRSLPGRLIFEAPQGDPRQWQERLRFLPGIANTLAVVKFPADCKHLAHEVPRLLGTKESQSFAIRARRDGKDYSFTSVDLGREIGRTVQEATGWRVDLKNPDQEIVVEVVGGQAYVGCEPPVAGYRGLPVGVSGKAMILLSGGFDSPVAAHLMQCRGLELIAAHFHSAPLVSRASLDKVRELSEVLGRSQSTLRLLLVPIVTFQKEVVARCPESLRVILYRRLMMRLAEKLALRYKAKCLITGDSLGQVASQTLENMTVVSEVVHLPVLRPLIGMNKEWILEKSHQIGTHDISVLPHEDCCGFLMPRRPATQARSEDLQQAESVLDLPQLMTSCLQETKEEIYYCGLAR